MDASWDTFAGVALGIGLAAATGFRVFLPLLIAGLAAHWRKRSRTTCPAWTTHST